MLRVAICDDEANEVRRIEGFVRSCFDFDITTFTSSKELEREIADGLAFDLYLLDIVMPKPDGIELSRIIRRSDKAATIIFLTSHGGRALDAYLVRAAQYLSKPVQRDTLRYELDIAITTLQSRNANTFLLKTKDGAQTFPFHRIAYCELSNRALCCVTTDGTAYRSITLRVPFEDAVSELLADSRFIRPHISFVVNMDHVSGVESNVMMMNSGRAIPIAHGSVSDVKDKYMQYFFKRRRAQKGGERE